MVAFCDVDEKKIEVKFYTYEESCVSCLKSRNLLSLGQPWSNNICALIHCLTMYHTSHESKEGDMQKRNQV